MTKVNFSGRKKARRLLVQAMYQWQVASAPIHQIEAEFIADNDMSKVDREYFSDVLRGVPREKEAIDAQLDIYLDRPTSELTPIELAVLRIGSFELAHRIDVPYKVIINESIDLAKSFGATDGHKYVNGILDKLAQKLRITEIRGPR